MLKYVHILVTAILVVTSQSPVYARDNNEEVMIAGYVAPQFRNKPQEKILVHARVDNLYFRDQLERNISEKIESESKKHVVVVPMLEILPPLKDYTQDEIDTVLAKEHIGSVLFVTVTESSAKSTSGWGFSLSRGWGRTAGEVGPTESTLRYTNVLVELFQVGTKMLMWRGEGRINVPGNTQRTMERTSNHLGEKTAEMLLRDGLIVKKRWNE